MIRMTVSKCNPWTTPARRGISMGVVVVVLLVVGVGIYAGINAASEKKASDDLANKLQQMIAAAQAEAKRELDETGGVSPKSAQLRAIVSEMKKATGGLASTDRKVIEALVAYYENLLVPTEESEKLIARLDELGWADAATIESVEEIDSRIEVFNTLKRSSQDLYGVFSSAIPSIEKSLKDSGLGDRSIQQVKSSLNSRGQLDKQTQIASIDIELVDLHIELLDFYKDNWGAWRLQGEMIEFDTDESLEKHNDLVAKIESLGERSVALLRELIGG